ncbi:MAG TPA: NAD-dependent epimerase/dehydratase family protein [Candidatus Dormibacteraeota bacterium]|nr:NAD-dependent epimerase/dehydratase family protein [Candidatus Dormibacteraeota bacterium]
MGGPAPGSWRVVVTGGAGFIGTHSVELLLAEGADVLVLDDLRHRSARGLPAGADLLVADVGGPEAVAAIASFRPQAILHLAAQGGVNRSWHDPAADATTNVLATVNMLQAAVDAAVPRLVFASSGGALYGDSAVLPAPEDVAQAPRSPYGAAKAACEVYVAMFARSAGLSALSLRYGNVYGPGQDGTGEAGVVAISSERLLNGLAPVVRGDGLQTRDFVNVADVAAANLLGVRSSETGAMNIATGVETTVLQVVSWIAEAAGFNGDFERVPAPPGEVRRSALDTTQARDRLGWSAQTALRPGLRHTYSHFRDAAGTQERGVVTST